MFHITKSTMDYFIQCFLELLKPKLLRNNFLRCFITKFVHHENPCNAKHGLDYECLIKTVQTVACKFYDEDYVNNFILKSIEERAEVVRLDCRAIFLYECL